MTPSELQEKMREATVELTEKITKAKLDAYERGLKDGGVAILTHLLDSELLLTLPPDALVLYVRGLREKFGEVVDETA